MSKNLLITAYLNEIPRNMSWPSATLSDWKHWFPTISCSQRVNENFRCKSSLSSLNFSAESSAQTHFQPKSCLLPPHKWQAAEEEHFICWLQASSFRRRAVEGEMEEESILCPCASLSTGVGTAVIIIIFSTGHNELQQNLLHSLWCFIISYLLFCSGVWLMWSERAASRVTALLAPS